MLTEEQFNTEILKLNNKLNAIYEILKSNQSTNTQTKTIVKPASSIPPQTNTTGLISKASIDFEGLIQAISDANSKNLVKSIFENKYPTITTGQHTLLLKLGSTSGFSI